MKRTFMHRASGTARRISPPRRAAVALAVLITLLAVLGLNLAIFAGPATEPAGAPDAPLAGAPPSSATRAR